MRKAVTGREGSSVVRGEKPVVSGWRHCGPSVNSAAARCRLEGFGSRPKRPGRGGAGHAEVSRNGLPVWAEDLCRRAGANPQLAGRSPRKWSEGQFSSLEAVHTAGPTWAAPPGGNRRIPCPRRGRLHWVSPQSSRSNEP